MPDAKQKIPKRIDLTGCSFQGKQLSAAELEERERHSEYMEQHRKEVADKVVILRRKHQPATGTQPETRKVSRRTRYFATNEIRKEYGIMKKPYETKIENILWCIFNQGPIDMKGISKILGYDDYERATRALSGPISTMFTCLGDKKPYGLGFVKRELDGMRNFYSISDLGSDKSVEVLYQKFVITNRQIMRDRKEKRGKANMTDAELETRRKELQEKIDKGYKGKQEGVTIDLNGIADTIQQSVSDAVSRTLGVKVEVTGAIKILFGFTNG